MLLRLIRKPTSNVGVTGQLWVIDHVFGDQLLCDTLEHSAYLIPELIYPVHVTHSPKFRRLLPLIDHVPGRSGIRIHAGNQAHDSKGCVLVGHANGPYLTDSRKVEQMVTKLLMSIDHSREEIRLEVTHYKPPYPGYPYTDHTATYATACAHECRLANDD